jgi:hypothetical protein
MSDWDEQEKRIIGVLGKGNTRVTQKTLQTYLTYLRQNLEMPCYLTGIEDFPWEERYVFGYGDEKEYEKLKKTNASYTDTFKLLSLDEDVSEWKGILVHVERAADKKKFTLPLADLEATDRKSRNYELLDDYSVWFVNYQ